MLFEYLVWKLIIDVNLVFAIENMQVVTVREVFALNLFKKVFAIFYSTKKWGYFVVPVQLEVIGCL